MCLIGDSSARPLKKSIETLETLLELIKSGLESDDDVMISGSGFGKFCVKNKMKREEPGHRKRPDSSTQKNGHIQMVRETERKTDVK